MKTLNISTILPAGVDTVWDLLQKIETLQYIAFPLLTFRPLQKQEQWIEGSTLHFKLKLLGFFPLGIHTIKILKLDKQSFTIFTEERNPLASVWRHTITIEKGHEKTTQYSDKVELYAGFFTKAFALWAIFFYKHRQKKWKHLLKKFCNSKMIF